jgi:hypothetical protein
MVDPPDATRPVRVQRYLPLAALTTALVIFLPTFLVAHMVGGRGIASMLVSAVGAMVCSLALAASGAALWKRQRHSRDLLFSELMLWGWLRRYWSEQRLSQARDMFESARKAGPQVNIEQLLGLSRLLEARNTHVHRHSQRVARHAVRIARTMGLSEEQTAKIRTAAEVHDIGKLYTPLEILNNPGTLTDSEYAVIQTHAARGAGMVAMVGDPEITAMVRHHHERIDGGGYPDHLVGSAIPIGARIIAIADTFDAITSDRSYRPAASQKKALDVISKESGAQLDAAAATAFLAGYSARRSVALYALASSGSQRAFAALQGASVSPLLPAIGAAGVLAISPGLFRVTRADQHPSRSVSRVHTLLPQAAGRDAAGAARESDRARISPTSRSGPIARTDYPRKAPGGAPRNRVVPAARGDEAVTERPSAPSDRTPSPKAPEDTGPKSPPTLGAPVTPPNVITPTVTVPSVTTPAITTPAATTPTLTTPSITVPSVTLPTPTGSG